MKNILLATIAVMSFSSAHANDEGISSACLKNMADFIGIQKGQTKKYKLKSNDENVSCQTTVSYDGNALSFNFGIKDNPDYTAKVIAEDKTNQAYFFEGECTVDLNAPAGFYNNGLIYSRHYRHMSEYGIMGQESFGVEVSKDANANVSFHFNSIINATSTEKNKNSFNEATCFFK